MASYQKYQTKKEALQILKEIEKSEGFSFFIAILPLMNSVKSG